MSAVAFDTLKFVETLKASGVPEKQAKAQAVALSEAVDINLASKQDIKDVKGEIKDVKGEIKDVKGEIKSVRTELKRDMKELESRLVIKLGGLIVAVAAAATAFDKLL